MKWLIVQDHGILQTIKPSKRTIKCSGCHICKQTQLNQVNETIKRKECEENLKNSIMNTIELGKQNPYYMLIYAKTVLVCL